MGIALIVPNVRGSTGYGKTFTLLDNGFKPTTPTKTSTRYSTGSRRGRILMPIALPLPAVATATT
jgi:hypothetical protein